MQSYYWKKGDILMDNLCVNFSLLKNNHYFMKGFMKYSSKNDMISLNSLKVSKEQIKLELTKSWEIDSKLSFSKLLDFIKTSFKDMKTIG
jgi:hypothetical protein